MNDRKMKGLFVPNIEMPKSCSECPVKRYNTHTGNIFCIPLNKVVGNCVFDNGDGYVGEVCTQRYKECQLQECFNFVK